VTEENQYSQPASPVQHRDDYPGVSAWLNGADARHWWVRLLDTERDPRVTPPTVADMFLGSLEVLVGAVDKARPRRLSDFISGRFRDPDPANLLSARLELVCAANLAFMHVPFEFGGTAEPDLIWNPDTDAQGWMEIHRGAFSVFDDFQQELEKELAGKGAVLTVRLNEWPLEVPDRNSLHTRISRAIDAAIASGSPQTVGMPELGDGVTGTIEPRQEDYGNGRIFVQHTSIAPSEGYLASVSARLQRKVEVDKAGQGRKGKWDRDRTILLIDISTAHLALLLSWDELAAWLDAISFDWDDLPFAGVAVCFTNLHSPAISGVCRYRPDLNAADRQCLEPVLTSIGLPITPGTAP
jgi:hypothetical protein